MKKLLFVIVIFKLSFLQAQETSLLFKEAYNLELKFKDAEALEKYKLVLVNEPANVKALVKCAELCCAVGARLPDKHNRKAYYDAAIAYAKKATETDSKSADAYTTLATANGKMTEVESENKKVVEYVREIKINADNALSINPNHAMANFVEGKWHYEMVGLNWAKKLAVKALYGGLPTASLEQAAFYLEKSKTADPYFVLTYLTLAKVYKEKSSPTQMIDVLNKLIKLPKRSIDDAAYIEEGKKMLADSQ